MNNQVIQGDCLEVMKTIPDNSVDSVVCDPPYGLSFMGKHWDYDVPTVDVWREVLRVLKPGGHLLSFFGTRTYHRGVVAIEDAGFEIRDMIAWVYGSGFPKSLNIGKVMDKFIKTGNASWNGTGDSSNGALGYSKLQHQQGYRPADYSNKHQDKSEITEDKAKEWEGWGTALKPANEPIVVARKPLAEKTVAENCLKWGTGGINIDGCRVNVDLENEPNSGDSYYLKRGKEYPNQGKSSSKIMGTKTERVGITIARGRFPANLIHDGSDEVVSLFPNSKSGARKKGDHKDYDASSYKFGGLYSQDVPAEEGSASRFFYCAKASKKDRNEGLEAFDAVMANFAAGTGLSKNGDGSPRNMNAGAKNPHPTVKPTDLMRYLCRLVTPKGGTVLDPFMGSGSTGKAAKLEGFDFIGIEREAEYVKIAEARINAVKPESKLL